MTHQGSQSSDGSGGAAEPLEKKENLEITASLQNEEAAPSENTGDGSASNIRVPDTSLESEPGPSVPCASIEEAIVAHSRTVEGAGPRQGGDEVSEPSKMENAEPSVDSAITFECFGRSDVGLVREHNEDNFVVADLTRKASDLARTTISTGQIGAGGAVFAVCDGMGGAAAGEVASQMAVDTLIEILSTFDPSGDRDAFAHCLVEAIEEAGRRIFHGARADRSRRGMGTTATVAGLVDNVLFVGQVGDSRAYILRDRKLTLLTKDQSLVNQLIEAGQLSVEEAEAFEHSNIILQALGTSEAVTVDLTFLELRRGDRLLLCSDGLSGMVHQDVIQQVLQSNSDLSACCNELIEMANAGGGHDNITVLLAAFDSPSLPLPDAKIAPTYQQYPLPLDTERERVPMKSRGRQTGASASDKESGCKRYWVLGVAIGLIALAALVGLKLTGSRSVNQIAKSPPTKAELF